MIMQEYLKNFLQFSAMEKGLSPNSLEAYMRDLTRYLKFLDDQNVDTPDKITRDHIITLMVDLRELGLSDASVAQNMSAIRQFHHFLVGEGIVKANPAEYLQSPKIKRRLLETTLAS